MTTLKPRAVSNDRSRNARASVTSFSTVLSVICDPLSTPPCAGSSTMTVRLIGIVAGPGGVMGGVCRAGPAVGFVGDVADFAGAAAGRLDAAAGFVACCADVGDVPWARPVTVVRMSRPAVTECRRTFKRGLGPFGKLGARCTCCVASIVSVAPSCCESYQNPFLVISSFAS